MTASQHTQPSAAFVSSKISSAVLRSKPSKSARGLGNLRRGQAVKVLMRCKDWLFVEANVDARGAMRGYVFGTLIREGGGGPANTVSSARGAHPAPVGSGSPGHLQPEYIRLVTELAVLVARRTASLGHTLQRRLTPQTTVSGWWLNHISKPYAAGKEKAYTWLIDHVRDAEKTSFASVRGMANRLSGKARTVVSTIIDCVELLTDLAITAAYGILGMVVGFIEGIAGVVEGLVRLVYTLVDLCLRFLYGFIDGGHAFDERAHEFADALQKLPDGLRKLLDDWMTRFSEAPSERQSAMIGELTGQVLAFIATFGLAASKAGQIPRLHLPMIVPQGDRLALAVATVDVGSPAAAATLAGTGAMMATGSGGGGSKKPAEFPRKSLRGVSEKWLKRNKPRGWREVPADTRGGWKWLDENGIERLRFMKRNGLNPSASQWARQANGYLRWQNAAGEFLDIDGNIVSKANPQFQELTHIPYEGL